MSLNFRRFPVFKFPLPEGEGEGDAYHSAEVEPGGETPLSENGESEFRPLLPLLYPERSETAAGPTGCDGVH